MNNETFKEISAASRRHLRAGMLDYYVFDLKAMGAIFGAEGKYTDKLKVLLLAFYMEISGSVRPMGIDKNVVAAIRTAIEKTGMSKDGLKALYYDVVRDDAVPVRMIAVDDGFSVLNLCIEGKEATADRMLDTIVR